MRHRPLVSTLTLELPQRPRPERTGRVGALSLDELLERSAQPFEVAVDSDYAVVSVSDRGAEIRYELGARGVRGGAGWSEHSHVHGDMFELRASAAEVMAVVREAERDEQVAQLTLAAAERCRPHVGRRLVDEVRRGRELERVSVRPFQLLVLERLVAGEPISVMCERGRFLLADGRPDTSWFLRRIGLSVSVCSRTGRRRWARTLRYELGARYAVALEADPHELGI